MSINIGYCNVGCEDRMDYTIIGAQANLAARLESIAGPSGIVMSHETYSLVQDNVQAQALEPITLKGITREVIPYVIDNNYDVEPSIKSELINRTTDRLQLHIDLVNLDEKERKKIETTLQVALMKVKKRN